MNIKPVSYSFEKNGRTVLAHLQLQPPMPGQQTQESTEKWFFNTQQIMQMNGIQSDPSASSDIEHAMYADGEAERDRMAESILDALEAAADAQKQAQEQIKKLNQGVVSAFGAALGASSSPSEPAVEPQPVDED